MLTSVLHITTHRIKWKKNKHTQVPGLRKKEERERDYPVKLNALSS